MGIDQYLFLLNSLKWTLILSAVAFACGIPCGLGVALMRTSDSRPVRWIATRWIDVFQGTPLLMQLFVVYYGLALLGLRLDEWSSVTIGFTLHASAFLGEIWRGAIEAVPRGQTEAAQALGLHYWARMKDVILPQALKISLPATIGFLVQLIKGTSLASIVGFVELTRAGGIIANINYRHLLVYAVVGLMYFFICWPLSLLGARLERKFAAASR
jgi:polar amino acid transport system permease protein